MLSSRRHSKVDYQGLLGTFLASLIFHGVLIAVLATTAIYYPPINNSSERFDFNLIWANLGPGDENPADSLPANVAKSEPAPPQTPPGQVAKLADETGEITEDPIPVATQEEATDAVAVAVAVAAMRPEKARKKPVRKLKVPASAGEPQKHKNVKKSEPRPPVLPPESGLPMPVSTTGETKHAVMPAENEPKRDPTAKPVDMVQSELESMKIENEKKLRLEAEKEAVLREKAEEDLRVAEAVRIAELERRSKEKSAREQQVAAEQQAKEKAARERLVAEQRARENAARERLAAEQQAREMAARERLAAEQQAREKAARERLAAEQQAREKAARERLAAEQQAKEKAARERLATEQLAREKAAQEKARHERNARIKAENEQRERERLSQARAAEEKAAKLKTELAKPVQAPKQITPAEPARQVAAKATEPSGAMGTNGTASAKAGKAPAPLGSATAELKQVQKQTAPERGALPPIKGDIKLTAHSEDDLSIKVHFIEYSKGKHSRPMNRGEAKALQKLTPIVVRSSKNTLEAVVEHAREGIYVFTVEQRGIKSAEGKFSLKLFDTHIKALTGRKISGETVVARLMMPEGILWEDDSAFTGNIEDTDSITKFNADTGLVWKEYRKEIR